MSCAVASSAYPTPINGRPDRYMPLRVRLGTTWAFVLTPGNGNGPALDLDGASAFMRIVGPDGLVETFSGTFSNGTFAFKVSPAAEISDLFDADTSYAFEAVILLATGDVIDQAAGPFYVLDGLFSTPYPPVVPPGAGQLNFQLPSQSGLIAVLAL